AARAHHAECAQLPRTRARHRRARTGRLAGFPRSRTRGGGAMTDLTSHAAQPFEIGVFTFGELSPEPGGALSDPRDRLEQLLEWARFADQAGLDVFGVGEHHRPDFAVSSPQIVLAAAARETDSIRLTSTVSVLSSADPVRLFEEFATVDLLSGGRAEIT